MTETSNPLLLNRQGAVERPLPALTALRAISNAALKGDKLPERIKIFNWGDNPSIKGNFRAGDKTAQLLHTNQRSLGFERVAIDYNHCTVEGSPEFVKGQPKAIFGYGRPHCIPGDGVYLEEITWTPLGAEHARNYEDLSPAAGNASGEIDFIHSVALTPNGCLHDVTFFSASGAGNGEANNCFMSMTQNPAGAPGNLLTLALMASALGLAATATEAEVTAELKTLSALKPLGALLKEGKVLIVEEVSGLDSRLKTLETAATKSIATLSATIDNKVITLSAEDLVKLGARIERIETRLEQQALAMTEAERTNIITLLSAEGRAPVNPETRKAYTAEELRKLDVTTLRVLHANTPVTVPLSARSSAAREGKTIDPNLKGRARFIAAQEAENASKR